MKNVPGINTKRILNLVFPGPNLIHHTQMPSFPFISQPTYKGKIANTVYKELIDNLFLRKFLGPFPIDTTHLRVHHLDGTTSLVPVVTMPMFVLQKPDSTPADRRYRMLFNAA